MYIRTLDTPLEACPICGAKLNTHLPLFDCLHLVGTYETLMSPQDNEILGFYSREYLKGVADWLYIVIDKGQTGDYCVEWYFANRDEAYLKIAERIANHASKQPDLESYEIVTPIGLTTIAKLHYVGNYHEEVEFRFSRNFLGID